MSSLRSPAIDFPTANPLQPGAGGNRDSYVVKLNPSGSGLTYSTYLGGSSFDEVKGIAVDAAGQAYVTGNTLSSDFPTANPLQPSPGGSFDAFVAKLNPTGSTLVYSTYFGGSGVPHRCFPVRVVFELRSSARSVRKSGSRREVFLNEFGSLLNRG
ncbi:MAG: SBBP repeat-containing protein [Acidobacteriota bacterium]